MTTFSPVTHINKIGDSIVSRLFLGSSVKSAIHETIIPGSRKNDDIRSADNRYIQNKRVRPCGTPSFLFTDLYVPVINR